MKKTFDKNLHDQADTQRTEQEYLREQNAEENQFLRLVELLKKNQKGCGELLSAIYLDGLSYPVLAEQMGVAEATLRQRKKRCLDNFRKAW